jgi:uncharacterized protein YodC (DUF2158 family)
MPKKRRVSRRSALKVGAVVHLNSDGPAMTIDAIKRDRATCVWFLKDQRKSSEFALASLRADDTPKSIQVTFVSPSHPKEDDAAGAER